MCISVKKDPHGVVGKEVSRRKSQLTFFPRKRSQSEKKSVGKEVSRKRSQSEMKSVGKEVSRKRSQSETKSVGMNSLYETGLKYKCYNDRNSTARMINSLEVQVLISSTARMIK